MHDTDTTGRAKVPGNNGEVVKVRQVDDTGMRVRDADNEGVVVCARIIRGSVGASARLSRSHAAMINVSQDVTPTRAPPPAGIRIARSSNRADLAQKANIATQKITILTREDSDTTRRTVIKIYRLAPHAPPFSLHERRQARQLPHVRGVRISGRTTDA